jgi:COMPASS component SWD2
MEQRGGASQQQSFPAVRLNNRSICSLRKTKVFKNVHSEQVGSLDFSPDGEIVAVAGDDGLISLYSAIQGKLLKTVPVKRYGCGVVRFSNHKTAVLCASKPVLDAGASTGGAHVPESGAITWDDHIRYLSLTENKYIRYFRGHRARVVSIAVTPKDDSFISAALDGTMRLWDIRYPHCAGVLQVRGRPAVAVDPSGLVAAVAFSDLLKLVIKLYDLRKWDEGPFIDFESNVTNSEPTVLKFSGDGRSLLVGAAEPHPRIQLLDAFNGRLQTLCRGHANDQAYELDACFSPDSQYVLSGSEDATIHIWERSTGNPVHVLHGHSTHLRALGFNPQYAMLVSACQNVVFWQPDPSTLDYM